MGICTSCCEDTQTHLGTASKPHGRGEVQDVNINQPDMETRRQLQAEAAERRLRETEGRGLADPEKVKRQLKKKADLDNALEQSYPSDRQGGLKWTTG